MEAAAYMENYMMRGQHTADRAFTRYSSDLAKMIENNEISTGPGRYALGVPNAYGNAVFVPNPTIRMQKWGASHDMSTTKTDVESDLRNLARPSVKTVCGQYTPTEYHLTPMPEAEFPRTYERLINPPCTLRGTGWNRWEWLCQNPQEAVLIPFEHGVDTKLMQRDNFYPKLTLPLSQSEIAQTNRFICSELYVEPAVPVARPQVERRFTNTVPMEAVYERRPVQDQVMRGAQSPYAVPVPPANPYEDLRREYGILVPPKPFTDFIAPH